MRELIRVSAIFFEFAHFSNSCPFSMQVFLEFLCEFPEALEAQGSKFCAIWVFQLADSSKAEKVRIFLIFADFLRFYENLGSSLISLARVCMFFFRE